MLVKYYYLAFVSMFLSLLSTICNWILTHHHTHTHTHTKPSTWISSIVVFTNCKINRFWIFFHFPIFLIKSSLAKHTQKLEKKEIHKQHKKINSSLSNENNNNIQRTLCTKWHFEYTHDSSRSNSENHI